MTASNDPSRKDSRAFFYESFAGEWDRHMNMPELTKRLRLVFGSLLSEKEVRGRTILDAGAGTGWFSRTLAEWGGDVVSMDLGPNLLQEVRKKCRSRAVAGSLLGLPFPDRTFDIALCTEVIEHTTDPELAVRELARVLRPEGLLVLTVPNRAWHFAVRLANALRLRPYKGHENWVGYAELRAWAGSAGLKVVDQFGFNLLPHTFFCRRPFDGLDRMKALHPYMINIALKARKTTRQA